MTFSRACEYAIRALIFVAACQKKGDKRVGIKEIAARIDIPERFTSNILQNLVKKGLLNSSKGPKGGYFINSEKQIFLWDIVEQVDGIKNYSDCALGLAECSETEPCPIHEEVHKNRIEQIDMLKNTSIDHLAEELLKGNVYLTR